jgi:putative spermidine/putrescine transport system ATP-binding protein
MFGAYLSMRDVTKIYGATMKAVAAVNLDIGRGEFVSFLGPSGSGKTTTLMMIAGFELPTVGSITLNGNDLTSAPPHQRNIGMVFQNYALFPHMTVTQNIGFPLRMRRIGASEIAKRVDAMIHLVGLGDHAGKQPRELSGGQQQRVALARALIFEPDILLLDEPLGALDRNLRERMQAEIKRIHRELGITMIYVTHDQVEAMTMSDRIAVFRTGGIEQVGTPAEIYKLPRSRFVGEFIGDSNFLSGRLHRENLGQMLVEGLGPIHVSPLAASAFSPGEKVQALIRPEKITVDFDQGARNHRNYFQMKVCSVLNYGGWGMVTGKVGSVSLQVRVDDGILENLLIDNEIAIFWSQGDVHLVGDGS